MQRKYCLGEREIIHLKGSHQHHVHHHVNTFLKECFKRKLQQDGLFATDERILAFLQLTDYYQQPVFYSALDELDLPPSTQEDIQKDVNRTFLCPDILQEGTKSERQKLQRQMRSKLTHVLQAFAKYNPYISYCQGMNNVIWFLLEQGFQEDQCFFILKKITEELLPADYFCTMNSTLALIRLIYEILSQTHPRAVHSMKIVVRNNGGEGITLTTSFIFQWFVCFFTNANLARNMRRSIFDHFLLEGLPALITATLCYFDVIEPAISKVYTFEEYDPIIKDTINNYQNVKHLRHVFNSRYINKHIFDLLLDKMTVSSDPLGRRQSKQKCNSSWTFCHQTSQQYKSQGYSHQCFVFRTAEEPKIIQNYLINHKNSYYFLIGKQNRMSDNIRIGRMEHLCRPSSLTSQTSDIQNTHLDLKSHSQNKRRSLSPLSTQITEFSRHIQMQQPQKQLVRSRALQHLESQHEGRSSVLTHSESIQFMKQMIQNQSFSNLMSILEVEEMDNLFRQCISEGEEEDQDNTE